MRVLLVQDNGINESLALAELSGWLGSKGHQTLLLLDRQERDLEGRAAAFAPDLIIVPCNVYAHVWVLEMLRRLQRALPDTPVLAGGTHATFSPDLLDEPEVSMLLVGEAELAVSELLDRMAAGRELAGIPGIWIKRRETIERTGPAPRLKDLDSLPLPDRAMYYRYPFMARFGWRKFSTGRGCVNRCAFCYNNFVQSLYGGDAFVRRKHPQRVLDEVAAAASESRLEWVHFADDLFVTDTDWLAEFCAGYAGRFSLPFSCNSSADTMTEEVARTLAEGGCRVVAMGVESACEETRMRLLKKPITNQMIEGAARRIKGAGMKLVTFSMVGLPGESVDAALETLAFSRSLGADAARILMAIPLPGTRMAVDAAATGHLEQARATGFCEELDYSANPYGPYYETADPAALENLVNLAPLLSHPRSHFAARSLLGKIPRALTRPFRIWMSLQEKSIYQFSFASGVDFFLHVGNPWMRTTNYVSLI